MKTISSLTLLVILVAPETNLSQSKPRPRPATKSGVENPVTVQSATTDDGKRVQLRSDGTWKYSETTETTPTVTVAPTAPQTSALSLEAGLVFKSGDIRPVARTEFHLLDESLLKILRDAGVQPRPGDRDTSDRSIVFSYGLERKFGSEQNFPAGVQEAINKHVIAT